MIFAGAAAFFVVLVAVGFFDVVFADVVFAFEVLVFALVDLVVVAMDNTITYSVIRKCRFIVYDYFNLVGNFSRSLWSFGLITS